MKKMLFFLFLTMSFSTINAQSSCEDFIASIAALGYPCDQTLYFVADNNLPSGWSSVSSTFEVTFKNGSVATYSGTTQSNGNFILNIPVYCNNRVMKVKVTGGFVNNFGSFDEICTDTYTKNFGPIGVCGDECEPSRISPNPAKNILNIQLSEDINKKAKTEVVIYNLGGTIEQKQAVTNLQTLQLNVSGLKPGNYILKIISDDRVIETKKIIISD